MNGGPALKPRIYVLVPGECGGMLAANVPAKCRKVRCALKSFWGRWLVVYGQGLQLGPLCKWLLDI
jgi:hypothetical protein